MRHSARYGLIAWVLSGCASTQVPVAVTVPRPGDVLLRVRVCASLDDCRSSSARRIRQGLLVFVDGDSLVMTNLQAGERVTIRPDSMVILEVYRGQHRSTGAVVRGGILGALKGAAVGVGGALLGTGLSEVLGLDGEVDFGEAVKGGVIVGAMGGAFVGGNAALAAGEATWERVTLRQLRQQLCRCPNPETAVERSPMPLVPDQR